MENKMVIFEKEAPEDREAILKENCYRSETMRVKVYFEESELNQFKTDQCELAMKVLEIEEEKKKIVTVFTERMKGLKQDSKELLIKIRQKYDDSDQTVYAMENQEESVMDFYDRLGNLVFSRPLLPQERQTIMKPLLTVNE